MPTVVTACLEPRCPHPAVDRGRCSFHRRTTTQRGYGSVHQAERRAALPGARCERCGCGRDLRRDHRVPTSLGGSQAAANKRWLCDCSDHRCHSRLGARRDRRFS